MKKMKKIFALLAAMVMVLAMSMNVFAADTGTITINVPTEKTAPTKDTVYKIYKVFDATVNEDDPTKVNYTLCEGDTLSQAMLDAGFSVDAAGNVTGPASLNEAAVNAIADYVTDDDLVEEVTAAVGETSVTSGDLDFGYYYITTTSGSVVTIDTNNDNPEVDDKNIIPIVVKSEGTEYDEDSMAAIAAVGTSTDFTAVITSGKGAKNLVFTDTMVNLTYNADAKVTVDGAEVAEGADTFTISGAEGDTSFTITFADDYIAGLAENTEITINYSGTVTSDALSVDPATNTAKITSGEGNESSSEPVEVYNAKFTVTKQDDEEQPLEGAGFVIANADGKYYKLAEDGKSIEWVDSIDDATEYTSDADGAVPAFTGLGVGKYTLIEKTVPSGYNKVDDSEFEIVDDDYSAENLEQTATVINKSGTELPSTGGIGTTVFYVVGALLVIGAGVVLVTRRRMNVQ